MDCGIELASGIKYGNKYDKESSMDLIKYDIKYCAKYDIEPGHIFVSRTTENMGISGEAKQC